MEKSKILKMVDHTLLIPTATPEDIHTVIDDGIKYGTATICIPACYIREAAEYANERIGICGLSGFPHGNETTDSKCFQAADNFKNGATELDMVANIGMIKANKYDFVLKEIAEIKKICGNRILKVIIETCLLNEDEKIKMCKVVSESGADYIKTSTGFSTGGATREDIKLFSENVRTGLGIKAAGGIRSFDDAEDFINLGATRLGTSALVKLLKSEKLQNY